MGTAPAPAGDGSGRSEPRRAALSRSGQERAKEFTWEASAVAHLETYRRAAAGVTV